jgi:hypothetical protein
VGFAATHGHERDEDINGAGGQWTACEPATETEQHRGQGLFLKTTKCNSVFRIEPTAVVASRLSCGAGARVRYARAVRFAAAVALLALGEGCRSPAAGVNAGVVPVRETRSNILRADYVGSAACATCHADIYAKWSASPMRKMTRDPDKVDQAEIRAPFAGETFDFKGDQATMFREGSARFVRMVSHQEGEHLFRVTRVIGNHYREDFAGVEVASTKDSVQRGTSPEVILPARWWATWNTCGASNMIGASCVRSTATSKATP